jgi:hypothetical protein
MKRFTFRKELIFLFRFRLPSAEKPALALALAKRGKRGAGDGM